LHAFFALNTTSNGVAEKWLAAYGLTNSYETDSTADQDGDQMLTWQEYIAGTDPTDCLSRLAFGPMIPVETNLAPEFEPEVTKVLAEVLEWTSVSGRLYTISRATNLPGVFEPLVPVQPATPPINRYTTTDSNAPRAFYRLDVQWSP
jgi:hypothetical protein